MGKHASHGSIRKRPASVLSAANPVSSYGEGEADHGPLPSVSELDAITDQEGFRTRAAELGIRVRDGVGSARKWRSKADILNDYRQRLDASSAADRALVFDSASQELPASSQRRTLGFASGSPSASSSGVLADGQDASAAPSRVLAFGSASQEPVSLSSSVGGLEAFPATGRTHGLACGSPGASSSEAVAFQGEQSALPSAAELEAITPISEFRKHALQLGLVVRCRKSSGSGFMDRRKADIMADYKQMLSESRRSTGSDGPALPASNEAAVTSASSILFRHGVSVQPGPSQLLDDDGASLSASKTTASSGIRVRARSRRDRDVQKLWRQSRGGKFARQVADQKRNQLPEHKEKDKIRAQQPERKQNKLRLLGTEEALQKDRARKATSPARARDRARKAQKVMAAQKAARARVERVYADRLQDTVEQGGTWKQAAQKLAEVEGKGADVYPTVMPPSFVGLHNTTSLQHVSEMYSFLKKTNWCTCVGCWRAWYHVPDDFEFVTVKTKAGGEKQWYQPARSTCCRARSTAMQLWVRS